MNLLFRKGCLSTMTFDLLRRIVYTRNGEEILKVLMSSEVSFYIADGQGASPLFWAAARNRLESVTSLLEHGEDLNA